MNIIHKIMNHKIKKKSKFFKFLYKNYLKNSVNLIEPTHTGSSLNHRISKVHSII